MHRSSEIHVQGLALDMEVVEPHVYDSVAAAVNLCVERQFVPKVKKFVVQSGAGYREPGVECRNLARGGVEAAVEVQCETYLGVGVDVFSGLQEIVPEIVEHPVHPAALDGGVPAHVHPVAEAHPGGDLQRYAGYTRPAVEYVKGGHGVFMEPDLGPDAHGHRDASVASGAKPSRRGGVEVYVPLMELRSEPVEPQEKGVGRQTPGHQHAVDPQAYAVSACAAHLAEAVPSAGVAQAPRFSLGAGGGLPGPGFCRGKPGVTLIPDCCFRRRGVPEPGCAVGSFRGRSAHGAVSEDSAAAVDRLHAADGFRPALGGEPSVEAQAPEVGHREQGVGG